jgi:hypothetical protein
MSHRSVDLRVPSCDRRGWIGRIRPIVPCALALGLALGCSDGADAGERAADPAVPVDAAGSPGPGAVQDGGSDAVPDAAPTGPDDEAGFGAGACSNGLDDNGNAILDCAEPSCAGVPYCCVGETDAACCSGEGDALAIDFASCEAEWAADCSERASAFGDPPPVIEHGAFVPNGNRETDAGLVLGDPVDATRERVTVRATIAARQDGCDGEACVDAVVLGVGDAPAGEPPRVHLDVAVMVRASRGDYALMIAGEEVARWPLSTSEPREYVLELAPDGRFELRVDGVAQAVRATYPPRRDRRVVLYGRTANRDGVLPARAPRVEVRTAGCDVPDALVRGAEPIAPWAGPDWGDRAVAAPSAVRTPEGETLMAVQVSDGITLLETQGAGAWAFVGDPNEPALRAPSGARYADPELVREADRYVLYLTHESADGTTLARATGDAGFATTFGAPAALELPAEAPPLESPAVVDFGGRRLLAATAREGGETRIVLLEATDAEGTRFAWTNADAEGSTLVREGPDFAFDDVEVTGADLWVDRADVLRLHYAGRRGTRWGIGLRVSADGATWRSIGDGGPLLTGSGVGHDALGVRDPAVLVNDGVLELFHTATDGVRPSVARAVGRAP